MDTEPRLLQPTRLLDFTHPAIDTLVERRGWRQLPAFERIGAVYDFVRNEIAFGYNASDELSASAVLADGVGQCNTKSTLLMALMRAVGIRCRYHGFTIDKPLQKGAITGIAYALARSGSSTVGWKSTSTGAGSISKASSWTRPTWPASSGGFRTAG